VTILDKMRARAQGKQARVDNAAHSLGLDDPDRREWLGGIALRKTDMPALTAGCLRVFAVLRDFQWHQADEIRDVAGTPGAPASEGLRRMRELRRVYEIDKRRVGDTRLYEYKLLGLKKQTQ